MSIKTLNGSIVYSTEIRITYQWDEKSEEFIVLAQDVPTRPSVFAHGKTLPEAIENLKHVLLIIRGVSEITIEDVDQTA